MSTVSKAKRKRTGILGALAAVLFIFTLGSAGLLALFGKRTADIKTVRL